MRARQWPEGSMRAARTVRLAISPREDIVTFRRLLVHIFSVYDGPRLSVRCLYVPQRPCASMGTRGSRLFSS